MWSKDLYFDWTQVALAILYAVLIVMSMYAMWRQKSGWLSWQRMFHINVFIGSLIRVAFFLLSPWITEGDIDISNQVFIILNSIPAFFFFSTYMLLIFLWAELVHKARYAHYRLVNKVAMPNGKSPATIPHSSQLRLLRPLYLGLCVVLFAGLAVLYVLDSTLYSQYYTTSPHLVNPVEEAIWFYTAFLALSTALAFLLYGLILVHHLMKGSSLRFMPEAKKRALMKVALISTLCTLAFSFRSITDVLEVSLGAAFQSNWWTNGLLWIALEYVPLLLILYILTVGQEKGKPPATIEEGREPAPSRLPKPWDRSKYTRIPTSDLPEYDSDYTSSPSPTPTPTPTPSPSPSGHGFPACLKPSSPGDTAPSLNIQSQNK